MLMMNDEALRNHLTRLPGSRPFTTAMARQEGVPVQVLAALVAHGLLRRPVRSVYLPVDVPDTLTCRLAALELMVPPGCFVTDHTAAWLHAGDMALLPNAHLNAASLTSSGTLGIAPCGTRWCAAASAWCGQIT